MKSNDEMPWFFWPLVAAGTAALWVVERVLSATPLYTAVAISGLVIFGVCGGLLWMRTGHGLLPAMSWAVPLSAYWVVAFAVVRPHILGFGLYLVGLGFLFAMISSDRLVTWWYRKILRSRPPQPPDPM